MADITAKMVSELRQATGLGMMDCKRALVEAEGDMAKAEEIIRAKFGEKVRKLAGRQAAEGVIACAVEGGRGALVEVNCETDFVAKDEGFNDFAKKVAKVVLESDVAGVEELLELPVEGGATVGEELKAVIGKLGENMSVRRFERIVTDAKLSSYLHGSKIGVMVEFEGEDETGHNMAMQVAAFRPVSLDKNGLPAERVESERRIIEERLKREAESGESGLSEEERAKALETELEKALDELTLMGQAYIRSPRSKVRKYLDAKKTTIKDFRILVVGEGIEKKEVDYAAEVAAAAKI